MKRSLMTAALCTALFAAPAFAQTTGSTDNTANASGPNLPSVEDKQMYDANPDWNGFFTDETFGEARSDDEIAENFAQLSEDRQDELKRDCERTFNNPGVHGEVTMSLCTQIMEM